MRTYTVTLDDSPLATLSTYADAIDIARNTSSVHDDTLVRIWSNGYLLASHRNGKLCRKQRERLTRYVNTLNY